MKKSTVLIVDDDTGVRESLADILTEMNYHTIAVGSGREALAIISEDIHIALIDIRLGDMSGLDVLKGIKETSKKTECILLTGYGSQETAIKAINLGAYSYILKPYDLNNLQLTIQRAIEKRKTEEELQRSEKNFRDLYNKSPDMYVSVSAIDGIIEVCNETLLVKTGFSRDEIIGQPVFSLYHQECLDQAKQAFQMFITKGEVKNKELVLKTKAGGRIDVSLNVFAVRDEEGNIVRSMSSWRDITDLKKSQNEQKKLRDQIQQAQKMEAIGTLAGGIAHDFNNILASIIGFTELALEDAPSKSDQEDNLMEVYNAGLRVKELVQQILTFARKTDQDVLPILPAAIVSDSLKLLRSSTPSNIEFTTSITSNYWILGNESQFQQVIMNLCTNACQAMAERGGILEIDLRNANISKEQESYFDLEEGRDYIQLTVSDNGPGIDMSLIDNIFEPYFTTKGVGEGTGMGLAMVKGIIDSHGGHIEVLSTANVKTQFTILLPVTQPATESDISPSLTSQTGTGHILLIDDEPSLTALGSKILKSLGYTVTSLTSSVEALQIFKDSPYDFDLVLSDITMPLITGDALAREVRKVRKTIPIVLCTGYSSRISDEKRKNLGVEYIVSKPYSKVELSEVIGTVLKDSKVAPDE